MRKLPEEQAAERIRKKARLIKDYDRSEELNVKPINKTPDKVRKRMKRKDI